MNPNVNTLLHQWRNSLRRAIKFAAVDLQSRRRSVHRALKIALQFESEVNLYARSHARPGRDASPDPRLYFNSFGEEGVHPDKSFQKSERYEETVSGMVSPPAHGCTARWADYNTSWNFSWEPSRVAAMRCKWSVALQCPLPVHVWITERDIHRIRNIYMHLYVYVYGLFTWKSA